MPCRRWINRLFFLARHEELGATMLPPAAASFTSEVEADGATMASFEEAARGSAEESPSKTTCPGLRCFRRRRVDVLDVQLSPPASADIGAIAVLASPPRILSSV